MELTSSNESSSSPPRVEKYFIVVFLGELSEGDGVFFLNMLGP